MNPLVSQFKKRRLKVMTANGIAFIFIAALVCSLLVFGEENYSLETVFKILSGENVSGASFIIMEVRLPRVIAAVLAGWSFGLAGYVFQQILRNPLASPDIIGVNSGTSVAAVMCILILHLDKYSTAFLTVISGVVVAFVLYQLAHYRGYSAEKLILLGLGMQALGRAVVSYLLLQASQYDLPQAMRWLTGSLSYARLEDLPLIVGTTLLGSLTIFSLSRRLQILELGADFAHVLGISVRRSHMLLLMTATIMTAFTITLTGPIACVSFLAGPIALGILKIKSPIFSGAIGSLLVLMSEWLALHWLPVRYPVGVVTGLLGAPYLIYLLFQMNRQGEL